MCREQSGVASVGGFGTCTPGDEPRVSRWLAFYSTVFYLGSFRMHPDVQLVVNSHFGAGCLSHPAVDIEVEDLRWARK